MEAWDDQIREFITRCAKHEVRMLMVGGGAVNFHGYQRHSADVDFWIDLTESNFQKLICVCREMGYEVDDFPITVKNAEQNISIKFSPVGLSIELITRFSIGKSFDEAFNEAEFVEIEGIEMLKWRVLSYDDLITSKLKASRPKDLLDIQELQRIRNT